MAQHHLDDVATGTEPVTRYLSRISVDRYPGDPERSNTLYRAHSLAWNELNLTATCRDETMHWQAKHDRNAFKEIWLLFDNEHDRFPLYPGESVWIEYAYTVGDEKWGNWFQRAVHLPTEQLEVQLVFPADLKPVVWGTETSLTAEASPCEPHPSAAMPTTYGSSPGSRPHRPWTLGTVWNGGSGPGPNQPWIKGSSSD
ncbi:hypothetical protein ACFYX6_21515 [Streptomyces bacillaris]|uniref:hypothetical protein n=1 Tax=Streptomyces TaxID=1883 RepID=UPI0034071896